VVDTATLLEEPWELECFPVVKWDWQPPIFGFLGIGMVEDIVPIQVEVNYTAQKIQKLMALATSMAWIQKGSGVAKINNTDWGVRQYTGRPPIFQTTSPISGEYFSHLDRLYNRAFEIVGVSQMAAQSTKPTGIESAVAMRTFYDIGTRRFRHTGYRWGEYQVACGEMILEMSRLALKNDIDITVVGRQNSDVKEINYSDIHMGRDDYAVRVAPASALPQDPAGKLETLSDLSMKFPTMQPHFVGMMEQIPDLENIIGAEMASIKAASLSIEKILEKGEYVSPRPHMDLSLTRDMATKEYLRAWNAGVSEERLDVLNRYIADIDDMLMAMQAPPAPAGMPGESLPGVGPTPGAEAQLGGAPIPEQTTQGA